MTTRITKDSNELGELRRLVGEAYASGSHSHSPEFDREYIDLFDRALKGDSAALAQVQAEIDSGELAEVLSDGDWGCVWT